MKKLSTSNSKGLSNKPSKGGMQKNKFSSINKEIISESGKFD